MTITIWTRAIRLLKNLNDSMLMLNSMLIFMHIVAFTIQFFIHFLFTCVFVYTPFYWHSTPLHSIAVSPFVSLMELISICLMSTLSSASFSLTYILCVVLHCIVSHIFCWWYSLSIVTILIQSTNKWQKNTLFEWWQKERKTYHSYLSLLHCIYVIWQRIEIYTITEWVNAVKGMKKQIRTNDCRFIAQNIVPRVECTHEKNVTTSGENAGTPPCEHFSTHVCAAEYSKCFTIAVSKNIKIITKKLWHEIQAGGCECAISNE